MNSITFTRVAAIAALSTCFNVADAQENKKPVDKKNDPQRQPGPYSPGPDSQVKPDVPRGTVTKHTWDKSMVFPNTTREYWVYAPANVSADKASAVMVFQDGAGAISEKGALRVPTVFDNLIHRGEMPSTVGIFINPGIGMDAKQTKNRSIEYDTVNGDYARFLLEEILPAVGQNYRLTTDPKMRAIAGGSSGGICAFNVAWQRPEAFTKVFSWVGSFTNIRGGNVFPDLVRDSARKPIRVYLQDGKNDLINQFGSWYEANQTMAKVLKEKDYDVNVTFGEGGHNPAHAGQILPEVLRWLWRDWKTEK